MRLLDIARQIGAEPTLNVENPDIVGLAPLGSAGADQLSFVVSGEHLGSALKTGAGALICLPSMVDALAGKTSAALIVSDNPYLCYARASALFATGWPAGGIHPTAVVHESVVLGSDVHVGANAVLEAGVVLESGASIGSGCHLGEGVQIGESTRLYPKVVLYHGVKVGANCLLHSGAVIGADGFGFAPSNSGWVKIHQLGSVIIGDRVEIGPNCTVARGALEDTRIGNGVIMDAQVLIAHNVQVGENTAFAGQSGVAGSTRVGSGCTFGGQSGVVGHIEIADNVHLQGRSVITKSISEAGQYSSLWPQQPAQEWRKMIASLRQMTKKRD